MILDRMIPDAISSAFCLSLLLAPQTAAQGLPTAVPEDVDVSSDKVEELSKYMQSLVDDGKIAGGVTMMARHGRVIHQKAVGMADRESSTPMQTDSIFRIASMTKPITSVAVMMLWEQGKLRLDHPVSKYIPEFKNPKVLIADNPLKPKRAKSEITIRHLLTHTSGLGYPDTAHIGRLYQAHDVPCGCVTSPVTLEENMKKLGALPLSFHPGKKWQYGMSTDVLGRVIEVVADTTLDRFFDANIFQPLGMEDTFFKLPKDKRSRLTAAYLPVEDGIRKLKDGEIVHHDPDPISGDYPYSDSHRYFSGGGDLCSTPSDYMRFCQMLLNGGILNGTRLLKEDTIKWMTTDKLGAVSEGGGPDEFGFGFGILPQADDVHAQLRGSYAWGGYWSTCFRISPIGDWIMVAMAQVAWQKKITPTWISEFEKRAAVCVVK